MFGSIWDWLALLLVVAFVYVLVRPQSKAAEAVEAPHAAAKPAHPKMVAIARPPGKWPSH